MEIAWCVIFLAALAHICAVVINLDKKMIHDFHNKMKESIMRLFAWF